MKLLSLLLLCTLLPLKANPTDEILITVQKTIEREKSFSEIEETLSNLSIKELKHLSATFEKAWSPLQKNYLQNFRTYAKTQFTGSNRSAKMKRVRELRKEFHTIRQLPEGPMKSKLKEISMPAMKELRQILLPNAKDLIADAPENLKKELQLVHGFARFRDLLQEYAVSVGAENTPSELAASEKEIVAEYQELDRKGLRIIENNDKIAAKADLPPAERTGIRELNEWRLLVEQNALEIDPKLCDAGRDHSKDMATEGFFAHISPVPGKKTPSDRAKKAGTTGGGENIYAGSTEPQGANKGWYYSPGHHKNMFNAGYKRVGLGQHNRHWTQMFGG